MATHRIPVIMTSLDYFLYACTFMEAMYVACVGSLPVKMGRRSSATNLRVATGSGDALVAAQQRQKRHGVCSTISSYGKAGHLMTHIQLLNSVSRAFVGMTADRQACISGCAIAQTTAWLHGTIGCVA
jgi:hypothetical protein